MSGIIGSTGGSGIIGTTELDYEEGEWDPGHPSFTFDATPPGQYIKIGKMVTCWGYFAFSSADSHNSFFTGLPFTADNTDSNDSSGTVTSNDITFTGGANWITPYVHNNTKTWSFYASADAAGWSGTFTSSTISSMYFMIVYKAA